MRPYGSPPDVIGRFEPVWEEYMHYMYLPVRIGANTATPRRLDFARELVRELEAEETARGNAWEFVYVTARRGYATPGNPLNRPGWHADGFGTDDVNYVWTDRYPTLFALQTFDNISADHVVSVAEFERQIDPSRIATYADRTVLRLDPAVIHAAPEIPAPGGERSFLKVSFSNSRYNLVGNSRNHDLTYEWPFHRRGLVRNDPAAAMADSL